MLLENNHFSIVRVTLLYVSQLLIHFPITACHSKDIITNLCIWLWCGIYTLPCIIKLSGYSQDLFGSFAKQQIGEVHAELLSCVLSHSWHLQRCNSHTLHFLINLLLLLNQTVMSNHTHDVWFHFNSVFNMQMLFFMEFNHIFDH